MLGAVIIYPIPGFSEPVSSLSHLLAAGVFAVLSAFLLRRGWGNRTRVAFLGVYVFSVVFLLSMSGVYHLLSPGSAGRAVLHRLDHGAIFVLIAGTFTPVHGIVFQGRAPGPLALIWAAAIAGITLKMIWFTDVPYWLGLMCYLGLGWVGAISGGVLWYRYGTAYIQPLLWGAVAYTVGALLELVGWPTLLPGIIGSHELFHVAVLFGAACHWLFIYRLADGQLPVRTSPDTPRSARLPEQRAVHR